ncbi:hypothetical protein BBJ28_00016375 [Nothophytophthora sp. Chile5]|nr:hypothetical protein BBJ28_00016375 [Nothophytophthora sp. Chile5]
MLRNSLFSAAVAWLLALCIAQGNVRSGLESDQQTYRWFLTVKILWFDGFYWSFALAASVTKLLPERFYINSTPSTLSSGQILAKLVPRVLPYAVGVTFISVAGGVGVTFLSLSTAKFKLDLYWTLLCCTFFVVSADTHTRHIFKTETVGGQTRELRLQGPSKAPDPARPRRNSPSTREFLHVLTQNLPFVVSIVLSAVYPHAVSFISIRSERDLAVLSICSFSFKVLAQELVKMYLNKQKRAPSTRSMAILVAAPTILIDTQLRTMLLWQGNNSLTLVGSVLLALIEIVLRSIRALHVRRQVQRIQSQSQSPSAASVVSIERLTLASSPSSLNLRGVIHFQTLMRLHAAEIYADMHAEYIAMGCSYAILFLFGSHPRFHLNNNASADSSSITHTVSFVTIVLQLGIAVVVDFVATGVEIHSGVDFASFNEDGAYLASFMAAVAVANIHISSSIYLRSQ